MGSSSEHLKDHVQAKLKGRRKLLSYTTFTLPVLKWVSDQPDEEGEDDGDP